MGRRLATAVHVQHPTSREWIVLEPGDEPDDDLAAEITNPDAWEDDEPSPGPEEPEPDEPKEDEPKLFGFTAPPEPEAETTPEAEPTAPAPRRRRKATDADE
ncbi:hypothetical protein [Streptomyces sp. ISID311]|uniref:hypothetical protein n=1 Tax=Streptomyces sp. ISID311 TaxID=2601673 RepID=UPI0011BD35DF|nr:hypothetical protein [Streptomyces sp. ISID311]TXC99026.1 hypothetical protein FS847_06490 [Streptomyces sp. ISID311]